jgi:N-acetylneuraminic acid mutarotase
VCGGRTSEEGGAAVEVSDVWRLNLANMRWEPMPALVTARDRPACCVVRGNLVVLGGETTGGRYTSSVEMLSSSEEGGAFVDLPPLSCGGILGAAAVAVD